MIRSSRGAQFYRCELSRTNPDFVRYPTLPVLACTGYRRQQQGQGDGA
jgi:hypothetical protein